ncbi:hypothetical protein [Erythrobacter sp.]|uniref:hypothetical protein n=1 Tax=Erythrobacter sp. TaxID=1042 RepID=UPI001B23946B|nr:hypothetical protein [Erythrobacter sp.]MBO6527057.1 hypothetical protein [Erythrobacter sp.]MBO6528937.1 hypothetical protein [Erythrobacter sp.]
MNTTRPLLASAPVAIAAMAALHAPAAVAQDATAFMPEPLVPPPIVASTPEPVSSPAPMIMAAPEPAPVTAIELPEAEPVIEPPVVREAEPVATTDTTRSTAPQQRAEAPAPAAVTPRTTAAPADETVTSAPTIEESTAASVPGEARLAAKAAPGSMPEAVNDSSDTALLFAVLGAGGIGLAALLLLLARRRRREANVPVIERPIVNAQRTIEREPRVTAHDAPLPAMGSEPSRPMGVCHDAAVELPAELPRDPEERRRLLQRMIAAEPDRANPFASPKARAKRARLILQSIGTRFTDRKPSIDLSQYTNVWPELRGWHPATV